MGGRSFRSAVISELSRGELIVAATYMTAGALFAASALTDPSLDPGVALVLGLPLVVLPPVVLRDRLAEKRLANPRFGEDLVRDD